MRESVQAPSHSKPWTACWETSPWCSTQSHSSGFLTGRREENGGVWTDSVSPSSQTLEPSAGAAKEHKTNTWVKTRHHTEKQSSPLDTACAKALLHGWIWAIKTFNPQTVENKHYPNHPGVDNKCERPENEDTFLKEPNVSTCRCTTKGADEWALLMLIGGGGDPWTNQGCQTSSKPG